MEEIFWPVLLTKATFNSFLKLRAKSFYISCEVSYFSETKFQIWAGITHVLDPVLNFAAIFPHLHVRKVKNHTAVVTALVETG